MKSSALHLICVFWGEEHCRLFLEVCLAALLGQGNLDALHGSESGGHKLVLCTTDADRRFVEKSPMLAAASRYAAVEFLDIGDPDRFNNKYLAMSHGHRLASNNGFSSKACAVFLTPDMILSRGTIRRLMEFRDSGAEAVLCPAVRFESDGVLGALKPWRLGDGSLDVPNESLIDAGLDHLHLEARKFVWSASNFARYPYNLIWFSRDGAVLLSFSWAPLLLDYGTIDRHDDSVFDRWTLDGDYIARNFFAAWEKGRMTVVTDSRELALISITPASEFAFIPENAPESLNRWALMPVIGWYYKVSRIQDVYSSASTDDLKRLLFQTPVDLHGARVRPDHPGREKVRIEASRIARRSASPGFLITFFTGLSRNGFRAALNFALTTPLGWCPVWLRRQVRRLPPFRRSEESRGGGPRS